MAFSEEQLARYSRQFVLREIGVAGQKKLLQSSVLVIVAGALGASALLYLTAAGVGTIGIADYDRIELSNLQCQIIHGTGTVGMLKTDSAKQALQALNPDVTLRLHPERATADNIETLICPYVFCQSGKASIEIAELMDNAGYTAYHLSGGYREYLLEHLQTPDETEEHA